MVAVQKDLFYLQAAAEKLFRGVGLDNFDALWRVPMELVDSPNTDRGGWSEVGRLTIAANGAQHTFYIKRQQNFGCRWLSRPWQTIPVAMREWLNITELDKAGIKTLDVVCAARRRADDDRMILVTRALDDYVAMDRWLSEAGSGEHREEFVDALGEVVARFHNAGFMHGCLYPKHVYISKSCPSDIRLIDLEKCKRIMSAKSGLRDLDTLLRRTKDLDEQDHYHLLASYREASKAAWTMAALQQAVMRRVTAKRNGA